MTPGFLSIPTWFSWENQGAGIAVADITGTGKRDLVVLMVDNPPGQNQALYRVGSDLDSAGTVTGGWSPWMPIPDWFSWENQGAGIAMGDLNGNGKQDLVVMMVDNPPGQNQALYRVGSDLDSTGAVTGGWGAWMPIPDWFSWENQGAGIAMADLSGKGKQDLVVLMVDHPLKQQNQALYRVGRDLDSTGAVSGGWGAWTPIPDWFSWENQGAGIAVADLNGNGKVDVVVFGIDNPPGQNQAFFRVANDVDHDGIPSAGWSSLLGVNNWFSWENQYAGIAIVQLGRGHQLIVMAVDHPLGGNAGVYTLVALDEDPRTHGSWQTMAFNSQVLAVHAAALPTGSVLFSAGSGNNPTRAADPSFGDVTKGMWTSVVWDPAAPADSNFFHAATIKRADGKPFDFFCGGDTFLADGSLLSAGGNQSYNRGNNLGQRDAAVFDHMTRQWSTRTSMELGRWYPTLLALADGSVLAVSGKNGTDGQPNTQIEAYDPTRNTWTQRVPPHDPNFVGLPYYAHLFLLADGRVFFSGGRMDDDQPQPQQAGILDFSQVPATFHLVPTQQDGSLRNQSSSVLLPPAQTQRVMIVGGGPVNDATSATGSAEVVALADAGPAYKPSMPLSLPRMHLNAVLLPDRTVFVSGGAIKHERANVPPIARLQAEIYDPEPDTWRPGAVASVIRMYHSVALLLASGKVVTASGNPPPGGDKAPWQPPQANEEMSIELYSPPYLFAGPPPTITDVAQEWTHGSAVTIASPQAGDVLWAELIRPGVTTHSFDNSQRLVDLPIASQGAGSLVVSVPTAATIAPPGWYMLFVVDKSRVPSTATWIHLN
jgi:hypothetical protein